MERKFFKNLKKSLEESDLKFACDCAKYIGATEVIIHYNSKSNVDSKSLFGIYRIRHQIETEKESRDVFGYNILLNNLNELGIDDKINVLTVYTEELSFLIFYNLIDDKIIGILKSTTSNIKEAKRLIDDYRKRKLSLNFYRFVNGNLVEEIKN